MEELDQNELSYDDPLEDLALRRKLRQQYLSSLEQSNNPMANMAIKLAGGGIDTLSRYYANRRPMEILTGISSSPGYTTNAREEFAAIQNANRQRALDQGAMLKTLEAEATRRKNAEIMAEYRKAMMEQTGEIKRAQLGVESQKAQQLREQKEKELEQKEREFQEKIRQFNENLKVKKQKAAGGGKGKDDGGIAQGSKEKVAALSDALRSLTDYEAAFDRGGRRGRINPDTWGIGSFISSSPIDEATTKLVDDIGRMRSGGAVTQDEEARFLQMLPRSGDSDVDARRKLANLRKEFMNKLSVYGATPSVLSKIGVSGIEFENTVRVVSPEGKIGRIPKENLKKALTQGYRVVE
jgi:hypothetical protein